MPFGSGIYNNDPQEIRRATMSNFTVKTGPGYTLAKSAVTDQVEATVHNSNRTEPAVNTGVLMGAFPLLVGGIRILWPNLVSDSNWELIFYVTALLLPVVTAFFIRGKVWSPASVKEVLEQAIEAAENTRKK